MPYLPQKHKSYVTLCLLLVFRMNLLGIKLIKYAWKISRATSVGSHKVH